MLSWLCWAACLFSSLCHKLLIAQPNWELTAAAGSLCSQKDVEVYRNLGALLHVKGQWREAEENYRMALSLSPDDRTTLTNLQRLHQLLASKKGQKTGTASRHPSESWLIHFNHAFIQIAFPPFTMLRYRTARCVVSFCCRPLSMRPFFCIRNLIKHTEQHCYWSHVISVLIHEPI